MATLSCEKPIPSLACTANCKNYVVQGRIYDGVNNVGLRGKPFTILLERFRYNCLFCGPPLENVYNGKTDENGIFSFSINVDSSLFRDYSLKFHTPEIEHYYNSFAGYIDAGVNPNINVQVAFYPTAILTLRLRRTQNDVYRNLRAARSWRQTSGNGQIMFYANYFNSSSPGNGDTTLKVFSVAGIQTNVTVTKSYFNGTFIDIEDSIVCFRGVDNNVTINY